MANVQGDAVPPQDEPFLPELPETAPRGVSSGQVRLPVVNLSTSTLLLGGGAVTRRVDTADLLRPSAIRGHLRFWWRALEGQKYARSADLYEAETALWGGARDEDENVGGRSKVEIRVEVTRSRAAHDCQTTSRDLYVLWPARAQKDGTPAGECSPAGTIAQLTVVCPGSQHDTVERALKAWILFGGIGSRTRRGVGSLTCLDEGWLPDLAGAPDGAEVARRLNDYLGGEFFGFTGVTPRSFPLLAGARLVVAGNGSNGELPFVFERAEQAWHMALGWLQDFRQKAPHQNTGKTVNVSDFAREVFGTSKRNPKLHPGRSRWPEADKMRHLDPSRYSDGHYPRHNDRPVWPRAGFGLPIVGMFQYLRESSKFEINWMDSSSGLQERMASPLIVKSLPIKGGFLACALWLHRRDPEGKVVLVQSPHGNRQAIAGSEADFSRLIAPGDTSLYAPIKPAIGLRDAFLGWVVSSAGAWRVA